MLRWSLRLHKWIALVVGIQILGWVLGGLIMTALPIHTVRGENRVVQAPPADLDLTHVMGLREVVEASGFGEVTGAQLKSTPVGPIWVLESGLYGEAWYDAVTGENVDFIDEAKARAAATARYEGPGRVVSAVLHEEAPVEAGTSGAVWQVTFDDPERSSFYLDAFTGELISQRSNLWRLYNFFYEIHVLDFTGSQNYNHPTIVVAAALALFVTVTGFVLLWFRVGRDLRSALARRRGAS